MRARALLLIAVGAGLGVALGPILLAAASGVVASSDEQTRSRQAYRLLAAYDEYEPQFPMHSSDFERDIEACGYRRDSVLDTRDDLAALERRANGEARFRDVSWTPYSGLFQLRAWRSSLFMRRVEDLRANSLKGSFGIFKATFLDQCLRHTLAAPACAAEVRKVLKEADLLSRSAGPMEKSGFLDSDRETRVICTYLDGLAVARGHPVAARPEAASR